MLNISIRAVGNLVGGRGQFRCRRGEGGGGHKMRHLYAGKTSEDITRQTLARDEGEEHLDNTRCPREQGKVSH